MATYALLLDLAPASHFFASAAAASASFCACLLAAASALRAWPWAFLEPSPPLFLGAMLCYSVRVMIGCCVGMDNSRVWSRCDSTQSVGGVVGLQVHLAGRHATSRHPQGQIDPPTSAVHSSRPVPH